MNANVARSGRGCTWALALSLVTSSMVPALCHGQAEPAPDCRAAVSQLLVESNLGLALPLHPRQVLIVTLPDPIATPAAMVFDSMIEALNSELGQFNYARERFSFPWKSRSAAPGPTTVSCPGVMLFRALRNARCARDASCQDLAIFIIPESSTLGINKQALDAALAMLKPTQSADKLRILGPYYSGTARSLRDRLLAHERSYRMASGSLSVERQAELLRAGGGVFRSFFSSVEHRRREARRFLGYEVEGAETGGTPPMALLHESGTLYGQAHESGDTSQGFLPVEYPPNLSELRSAYADLPENKANAALVSRARDFPYQPTAGTRADDVLPVYAPQDTLVAHDLAIRAAAEMLAQRRVGDLMVSGVLAQDRVFLAQRLKTRSPDLRIVFDLMDRILLHSDSTRTLDGSLVVTTYPLLDTEPRERHDSPPALRTTLARDTAFGFTRALHWLMQSDAESGPPFDEAITIGVVSRGHLWPITSSDRPPILVVPLAFCLVTLGVLLLGLLNSVLLLRIPADSRAPPTGKRAGLWTRIDRRIDRSQAWFARGLEACREPALQSRHACAAISAQTVIFLLLVVLSAIWCMLATQAPNPPRVSWWARWIVCTTLTVASLLAAAMFIRRVHAYLAWLEGSRARAAVAATEAGCGEHIQVDLIQSAQRWSKVVYSTVSVCLGAFTFFTLAGLFAVGDAGSSARGFFLSRSLDLCSGASPLAILLASGLLFYHFAVVRAATLHVLDGYRCDADCSQRRAPLCHAIERRDSAAALCEQKLFEAVLLQGGFRHTLACIAAIAAPMLLVLQERPSAWRRVHDFSLENAWLNAAMALGIVLSFGITVASTLKLLRIFYALRSTLRTFAMSDFRDAFDKLPGALRRTPADMIALGRSQDALERDFTTHLLQQAIAGAERAIAPARSMALAANSGSDTYETAATHARDSVAGSRNLIRISEPPQILDIESAAARARSTLRALRSSASHGPQGEQLLIALAGYVTHCLVPWLRQFRALFWLATSGTVALLCMSSLYVFSVRRLLVTTGVLLTLGVVSVSSWVLVGLERDEVLSRIGNTKPGSFRVGGNLGQIIKWGVFPLLLAAASYYPDLGHSSIQLLKQFGLVGG